MVLDISNALKVKTALVDIAHVILAGVPAVAGAMDELTVEVHTPGAYGTPIELYSNPADKVTPADLAVELGRSLDGREISVEVTRPDGSKTTVVVITDTAGKASTDYAVGAVGEHNIKASFAGDLRHAPGTANSKVTGK